MVFMPRTTFAFRSRSGRASGRLSRWGYKARRRRAGGEVRRLGEFSPLRKSRSRPRSGTYRAGRGDPARHPLEPRPLRLRFHPRLLGRPGNIVEDEIPVTWTGAMPTALGYSLDAGDNSVGVAHDSTVRCPTGRGCGASQLASRTSGRCRHCSTASRIHPLRVRFAFNAGGQLPPYNRL